MAELKTGSTVGGVGIATLNDIGGGCTGVKLVGNILVRTQITNDSEFNFDDYDFVVMGNVDFIYRNGKLAVTV